MMVLGENHPGWKCQESETITVFSSSPRSANQREDLQQLLKGKERRIGNPFRPGIITTTAQNLESIIEKKILGTNSDTVEKKRHSYRRPMRC